MAGIRNETVLLEPGKVNFALYKKIDASNRIVEAMNPTSRMKAVKNPVEMENLRKAHLKDGVALTKFLCWMKKNAGKVELTETEAAERLEDYRKAQEGYLGPSFTTISAFGSNAAMCHYHATKEQESPVGTDGFYLVDSGGQYYEGTTDVTRTIAVGHVTDEMKEHFTLVMMGMLRLMNAKFLYGCRGLNVDYLARGPLWERGFDFNHGTGHGVGFLSAVMSDRTASAGASFRSVRIPAFWRRACSHPTSRVFTSRAATESVLRTCPSAERQRRMSTVSSCASRI